MPTPRPGPSGTGSEAVLRGVVATVDDHVDVKRNSAWWGWISEGSLAVRCRYTRS